MRRSFSLLMLVAAMSGGAPGLAAPSGAAQTADPSPDQAVPIPQPPSTAPTTPGPQTPPAARPDRAASDPALGLEELRQQLSQAGFRDVRILDTAYLVQARTPDGRIVVMMINPTGTALRPVVRERDGTRTATTVMSLRRRERSAPCRQPRPFPRVAPPAPRRPDMGGAPRRQQKEEPR